MTASLLQRTVVLFTALLCISLTLTNCHKEPKDLTPGNHPPPPPPENEDTTSNNVKPNIILFIANDVGYEYPGFTGGHSYQTPTLDMMAANGVFFMHAYHHPDGFPSRLAFYTGKYNFRNYISWAHYSYSEKTFGNMLSDAGYKTCYVGKWQQDDGDYGITQRGWQNYRIFLPFQQGDDYDEAGQRVGRYKDPKLYEAGAFMPDSLVKGKYSEDLFSDYLCKFIDSNKSKPFVGVYSLNLSAKPYVPAPDDPDFATWNSANDDALQDIKYLPGMVKYMDKTIKKVLDKLQADGLASNTFVFYLNATADFRDVNSIWGPNNQKVTGGKMHTHMWGTQTPVLVYCPGKITPRIDRTTLIDYTDFLPTIADLTKTPRPTTYGTLDGVSFADNIKGVSGKDRDWVFCHWDNDDRKGPPAQRWVNDTMYKLYDTLGYTKFYNITVDTLEKKPIPDKKLTRTEKAIKENFIKILQKEHL